MHHLCVFSEVVVQQECPGTLSAEEKLVRKSEMVHILTASEWAVLDLQAAGFAYKEIAASLHISKSTVSNHLVSIRMKLAARNAIDAINKAYDRLHR